MRVAVDFDRISTRVVYVAWMRWCLCWPMHGRWNQLAKTFGIRSWPIVGRCWRCLLTSTVIPVSLLNMAKSVNSDDMLRRTASFVMSIESPELDAHLVLVAYIKSYTKSTTQTSLQSLHQCPNTNDPKYRTHQIGTANYSAYNLMYSWMAWMLFVSPKKKSKISPHNARDGRRTKQSPWLAIFCRQSAVKSLTHWTIVHKPGNAERSWCFSCKMHSNRLADVPSEMTVSSTVGTICGSSDRWDCCPKSHCWIFWCMTFVRSLHLDF